MGDKTIPDSAEPRLESFCPPFVADIDLPHQGVVDSYNLIDNLTRLLLVCHDLCIHIHRDYSIGTDVILGLS